jgi:NADPH-dependent glutamate synthase beta subunit-like oxidoreductase
MEAARTAAQGGRRVVLYERAPALGGAVALAAQGPGRSELRSIVDYLQAELARLGVEVHTSREMTAEQLLALRPHSVIVATGAQPGPGLLPIPGRDLLHVSDMRRVLAGEPIAGERVVVVDETDGHGVLSVVEKLATEGKQVEVVSEEFYVGRDLVASHDLTLWKQRVLLLGVVLTLHTSVIRIEPHSVIVADRFAEGERTLPADAVVLGTYDQPDQALYLALKGRVPQLFRIGDCVAPRRIEQAIAEGRQVGERI